MWYWLGLWNCWRFQITFFTRLAIHAGSWLGAQVRLLVEGLGFPSCQSLYEPSWAFSQYDGWVPSYIEAFHTRRQKLKITQDATIMSTIFYWSRQVTRLVKIQLSVGGMERPHCKRGGTVDNVAASFGNISTTVQKMCFLLSPLLLSFFPTHIGFWIRSHRCTRLEYVKCIRCSDPNLQTIST